MPDSKTQAESTLEAKAKRDQREPRALSTEYHKARKQLMLWAAVLFIWELVGIDLEKARGAGGNAGAIISAIKSPQAVPWALLILVAYFLFKSAVEWHQCSSERRRIRASRIDYASAWIVSVLAYALYFGQTVSHIQFADAIQKPGKWAIVAGLFAGFFLTVLAFAIWGLFEDGWNKEDWTMAPICLLLSVALLFLWPIIGIDVNWVLLIIGFAASCLVFGAIGLISRIPWHRLTFLKRLRKQDAPAE